MGCFDGLFHLFFHVGHLYTRFHGETDQFYGIAQVVHLPHRSVRQGDGFGSLSLDVDIALGRAHAYYPIVDTVYLYVFAAGVTSFGEETFVDTFANHTYFARLTDVHVVDEPSISNLLMLYLFVVRIETFDAAIVFVTFVDGCLAPFGH